MYQFKSSPFGRAMTILITALFILSLNAEMVCSAETGSTTKVTHKPIKYFVPKKRIRLVADVTDEQGVALVRCYFRGGSQADYVFVGMDRLKKDVFEAVLPAASPGTRSIEYLFLVVNKKNQVIRTQEFLVQKEDRDEIPAWQIKDAGGNIHVSTELAKAPESIVGFTDSIVVDVVESAARFGFVAGGVYAATQITAAGGTSGAAAAATSGGAVTASTGGSTATIVGVAAGLAVVGGGAALVAKEQEEEEFNASASIEWGDYGGAKDDSFMVWFAGAYLGESPRGGSGSKTVSNLKVGSHELKITFSGQTGSDLPGTYYIKLGGGATFSDGNTEIEKDLANIGDSHSHLVNVPEP